MQSAHQHVHHQTFFFSNQNILYINLIYFGIELYVDELGF